MIITIIFFILHSLFLHCQKTCFYVALHLKKNNGSIFAQESLIFVAIPPELLNTRVIFRGEREEE